MFKTSIASINCCPSFHLVLQSQDLTLTLKCLVHILTVHTLWNSSSQSSVTKGQQNQESVTTLLTAPATHSDSTDEFGDVEFIGYVGGSYDKFYAELSGVTDDVDNDYGVKGGVKYVF